MSVLFKLNCRTALTVAALSMLLSSVDAGAQKTGERQPEWRVVQSGDPEKFEYNRDENGKIVKGAYLTNLWYDNWSFGAMGGVQALVSGTGEFNRGFDLGTAMPTASIEVFTTKWFTPTIGMRAGFQGGWLKENRTPVPLYDHYQIPAEGWTQSYAHVDLLWNVINTFSGYRMKRTVNVSPYVHGGYYRIIDRDANYFTGMKNGELYRDREMAVGAGLLTTVHLGAGIDAVVDIRDALISGRYHSNEGGVVHNLTASVGLQYTIKKMYFKRARWIEKDRDSAVADAMAAQADARRAVAAADAAKHETHAVQSALEEAEMRIKELEGEMNTPAAGGSGMTPVEISYLALKQRVENADLVLYYYINHFDLNFSEEHHLDNFVTKTLAENPDHVFYLTGSADKQTGSYEYNIRLSAARANMVKKILMEKYGVKESNVVIKQTVVSDKHIDGALDRCVIIESE